MTTVGIGSSEVQTGFVFDKIPWLGGASAVEHREIEGYDNEL